jgi:hypothetical protein
VTQASVKRCGVEMMSGEGLPLRGECVWEGGGVSDSDDGGWSLRGSGLS